MKIILSLLLLTLFVSCSKEEANVETDKPATTADVTTEIETKTAEASTKVEAKAAEVSKELETKTADLSKEVETKTAEVATKIEAAKSETTVLTKAIDAVKSANYEVACGKCVFKDAECKTCKIYVKLGENVFPVMGLDLDANKLGLCKTSATADVKGEVKDKSFFATSLENLKLNLPDLPSSTEDALDKIKKIGF